MMGAFGFEAVAIPPVAPAPGERESGSLRVKHHLIDQSLRSRSRRLSR